MEKRTSRRDAVPVALALRNRLPALLLARWARSTDAGRERSFCSSLRAAAGPRFWTWAQACCRSRSHPRCTPTPRPLLWRVALLRGVTGSLAEHVPTVTRRVVEST